MRKWTLVAALAIAVAASSSADAAISDKVDINVSGRFEAKSAYGLDVEDGFYDVVNEDDEVLVPGVSGRFWLDLNTTIQATNNTHVYGRVRLGGPAFLGLTNTGSAPYFFNDVFGDFNVDRLYVENSSAWWENGPVVTTRIGRQEVPLLPDLYQPTADGIYVSTNVNNWNLGVAYQFFDRNPDPDDDDDDYSERALGVRLAGAIDPFKLGVTLVHSNGDEEDDPAHDDHVLQWGIDASADVADGVKLGALFISGHNAARTDSRTAWQVEGTLDGGRMGINNWTFSARYRDVEDGFATRFGGSDARILPGTGGQVGPRQDDGTHWQLSANGKLPAGPLNELLLGLAIRGFEDDSGDDEVGYAVDLAWAPGNGLEAGIHYTSEWQGNRTYYGPSSGMYYYLPADDVSVTLGYRLNF